MGKKTPSLPHETLFHSVETTVGDSNCVPLLIMEENQTEVLRRRLSGPRLSKSIRVKKDVGSMKMQYGGGGYWGGTGGNGASFGREIKKWWIGLGRTTSLLYRNCRWRRNKGGETKKCHRGSMRKNKAIWQTNRQKKISQLRKERPEEGVEWGKVSLGEFGKKVQHSRGRGLVSHRVGEPGQHLINLQKTLLLDLKLGRSSREKRPDNRKEKKGITKGGGQTRKYGLVGGEGIGPGLMGVTREKRLLRLFIKKGGASLKKTYGGKVLRHALGSKLRIYERRGSSDLRKNDRNWEE